MAGERSNSWIVWIRRGGGLDGGGDPGAEGLDVNSMHGGGGRVTGLLPSTFSPKFQASRDQRECTTSSIQPLVLLK